MVRPSKGIQEKTRLRHTSSQPPAFSESANEPLVPVSDLLEERESYQRELERQNTALRKYQAELEQSRSEYRQLFELAPIGYFIFDEAGIIHDVNLTGMKMLHKARRQVLHKSFFPFLSPEDRHQFGAHLAYVIESGERQSCDVCLQQTDGKIFVEIQSTPIHNENDDEALIRSAMIDITVRSQMEEELIAEREKALLAVRFMNELLANMSHEIRTPLAGVIGFAEVLEEELPPEYTEIASLIASGGNRLLNTLNSVLDFAKLKAHHHRLVLAPINVVDRVRRQCKLLSSLATQKELALRFEADRESMFALLDDSSLDRILNNLIGNAIKYTHEGEVCVRVIQDHDLLEIQVVDTGIGINDEFLPKIFAPFQQEHMGDDRPYEGVGLGLTITKRLLDLMNGEILVESQPGAGSCFTVRFAILEDEVEAVPPRPATPPADEAVTELPRYRVLVVEDNLETQLLINRLLRSTCDVTLVDTFDSAAMAFADTLFDIGLLDINLGEKRTGTELLNHFRSQQGGDSFYAVAFTAYALPSDRSHFLAQGFDDYLPKPFVKSDLMEVLQRAHKALQASDE